MVYWHGEAVPRAKAAPREGALRMIYGMGIDCAAIARVARSMRRAGFCEKVFSEAEQAALDKLPPRRRAESGAACFAAKEAFLKAAGVGLGGFALREIAALRRESGQPYYACSGAAAQFCEENSLRAHLSLTHESGLAIACAVLETHTGQESAAHAAQNR